MTISAPDIRLVRRDLHDEFANAVWLQPQAARSEPASPAEICSRICDWSAAKERLQFNRLVLLGLLGGCYIGFGGALYTLVASEASIGYGVTRWLAGIAFSLGLILVVIGGAELSTGNCLMAIARVRGCVRTSELWRNWVVTFLANALGAVLMAWLVVSSGALDAEPVRNTALRITEAKLALPMGQAFCKGVLANVLVCLAIWLAMSASSVPGKVIGIVFPISAFVSLGFEHSIANLYLIPVGVLLGAEWSVNTLLGNLLLVTFGNLAGGALLTSGILVLAHSKTGAVRSSTLADADAALVGRAVPSRRPALGVATIAAALIVTVSLLWIYRETIAEFVACAELTQRGWKADDALAALQKYIQHQDHRFGSLNETVRDLQSVAAAQAEEIVQLKERIAKDQTGPETIGDRGHQER